MRWLIAVLAAAAIPVVAVAEEGWPRVIGPNLVANAGFEEGTGSGLQQWRGDAAVYAVDRSPGRARAGTASLRYRNEDASRYMLATQEVKLQPGALYEYSAWVRTEGVSGSDSGAAMCLEWSDANGKWLGGSYGNGIKGSQDWTQLRTLVRVPTDAAKCTLTCYLRKGMTGTAWFDEVSLVQMANRPMRVVTLEPNYRGRVTGDTVKARTLLNWQDFSFSVPAGGQWEVAAELQDRSGKVVTAGPVRRVGPGEGSCDLALAVPQAGSEWNLVVRLKDQAGKPLITASEPLVRATGPTPAVSIDARGRTMVDGRPFFPLGFYLASAGEEDLKLLAQSKVNCIMPYGSPNRAQMDLAQKNGLRVIYSTKDFYHGTQWAPTWLKSQEQEEPAVRERVREFRNHPALLAWYLNDELPVSYWPRLAAHQRWTAEEDPDHPTWAVLYQVDEIGEYLGTCDVIGSDPYPIGNANARLAKASLAGEWTRKTVAGMQRARPVWMVPQVFAWNTYGKAGRTPTIAEVRSMSWQCIAEGATGLVYYSWFDLRKSADVKFDEHWARLRQVIAEIDRMAPVILAEESAGIRVVARPTWLHTLLRRHEGREYCLLVNNGDGEGPVTLQIGAGRTANVVAGEAKLAQGGESVQVEIPRLGMVMVEVR